MAEITNNKQAPVKREPKKGEVENFQLANAALKILAPRGFKKDKSIMKDVVAERVVPKERIDALVRLTVQERTNYRKGLVEELHELIKSCETSIEVYGKQLAKESAKNFFKRNRKTIAYIQSVIKENEARKRAYRIAIDLISQ
jgi:hypothetical protein